MDAATDLDPWHDFGLAVSINVERVSSRAGCS
ncbi:hypothetical protein EV188_101891 [Actinomycetospora succinea]|uniref:Uncharacterized protein n=1 Tax=Actinomycetospora succinea TaxID=663603 RepID=A0A4R6VP22_9PSEU|nr:hypothetical protein EV188_101891 [Actinomycetospora succinea]